MKMLQLLSPPDLLPGLRPWIPLGDFCPQTPWKSLYTLSNLCVLATYATDQKSIDLETLILYIF